MRLNIVRHYQTLYDCPLTVDQEIRLKRRKTLPNLGISYHYLPSPVQRKLSLKLGIVLLLNLLRFQTALYLSPQTMNPTVPQSLRRSRKHAISHGMIPWRTRRNLHYFLTTHLSRLECSPIITSAFPNTNGDSTREMFVLLKHEIETALLLFLLS